MPSDITMPQLTDTMTEGTLVKWHKKEGDKIKAGEIDRRNRNRQGDDGDGSRSTPARSRRSSCGRGKSGGRRGHRGARHGNGKSGGSEETSMPAAQLQRSPRPAAAPAPSGLQAGSRRVAARTGRGLAPRSAASLGEIHEPDHVGHGATRETASPFRRPARRHGNGGRMYVSRRWPAESPPRSDIDLQRLAGSGPGGRVVQRMSCPSRQAPKSRRAQPSSSRHALGSGENTGHSAHQDAVGHHQGPAVASKQNIPHFYETIDVEIEELTQSPRPA